MSGVWIQSLRQRLFASWIDTAITLVCLYIVWRLSVPLVHWLLLDAAWNGTTREDCKGSGACWVFVKMRFGIPLFFERSIIEITPRRVHYWPGADAATAPQVFELEEAGR